MDAATLLRRARRRGGLSQAELARRLATKQPVIARWETGARSPSYDAVRSAIRAAGFELEVRLVPVDPGEDALITEWLRLSPRERLARNRKILGTERWAMTAIPRRDADARR